jgi:hypothetical protein
MGQICQPFDGFSKSAHLHSSVLENLAVTQTPLLKPVHPSFHFSSSNDGYYYLFSLFFYLFPSTRRFAIPNLLEPPWRLQKRNCILIVLQTGESGRWRGGTFIQLRRVGPAARGWQVGELAGSIA